MIFGSNGGRFATIVPELVEGIRGRRPQTAVQDWECDSSTRVFLMASLCLLRQVYAPPLWKQANIMLANV
jgi:hypothetical protein